MLAVFTTPSWSASGNQRTSGPSQGTAADLIIEVPRQIWVNHLFIIHRRLQAVDTPWLSGRNYLFRGYLDEMLSWQAFHCLFPCSLYIPPPSYDIFFIKDWTWNIRSVFAVFQTGRDKRLLPGIKGVSF